VKFWVARLMLMMVGTILVTGGVYLCTFSWTVTPEFRASYGSFSIAGAIILAAIYVKEDRSR
jgi:hypothetical protein